MDVELVLIVDEVQKVQRDRYICFIAQIFHLSYAALFQEPIDKKKVKRCVGCDVQHPSQIHHAYLMMNEEEFWNLYYDTAIKRLTQITCGTLLSQYVKHWSFHYTKHGKGI